jgi:hypothetical protein
MNMQFQRPEALCDRAREPPDSQGQPEPLKGADEPVVDVKFFIDDFRAYSN